MRGLSQVVAWHGLLGQLAIQTVEFIQAGREIRAPQSLVDCVWGRSGWRSDRAVPPGSSQRLVHLKTAILDLLNDSVSRI